MHIRFATCERPRALSFLRKFYPSYQVEDTPECAGPVLDLVQRDIVRIPDPEFHPNGAICLSKGFEASGVTQAEVVETFRAFNAGLSKKDAA